LHQRAASVVKVSIDDPNPPNLSNMISIKRAVLLVLCLGAIVPSAGAQNSLDSQSGFGYSIDVDGGSVFVGEPLNHRFPGMVYVFQKDEMSEWSAVAELSGSESGVGDRFGNTVLASGDWLFASATGTRDTPGVVYAFLRNSEGVWTETAVIRPDSSEAGDAFGRSLAYSDGRLYVSNATHAASPKVFVFSLDTATGSWSQSSVLEAPTEGNHSAFGASLAADGDVLLVGTPRDELGSVRIYEMGDSGAWSNAGILHGFSRSHGNSEGDAPTGDAFGSFLNLVGETLYVTAPGADGYSGRVYSYRRGEDGSFHWSGTLTPFDGRPGFSFARSVAVTGNDVWVSALTPNKMSGATYLMHLSEDGRDVMSAQKRYEPRVLPQTFYGETMAADGDIVAVGAYQDVIRSGAVYVYERDPMSGTFSTGSKLMAPTLGEYSSVVGKKIKCEDGDAAGFGCDHVDLVSFMSKRDLGAPSGILMNDLWGWTDDQTGKEYALAGRNDGTSFVDISDPANPVYLGFLPRTAGSPASIWRDIKVYKDHAFIVADGAGAHGVQIFDLHTLRNVANPPVEFAETAHYDGIFSAHNIVINEETGFAYSVGNSQGGETCGGGSHIIDIRDPENPKFAGCFAHTATGRSGTGYTHDAQCVTYKGPDERFTDHEICFAANETAISIADVSDKDSTRAIARGDYPNPGYTHQGWLSEDHRYFFVNDELDEINGVTDGTRTLIWDVAQLDDPILVNEYVSANKASDHNLYVKGHYMYQSNYVSGLRVVDVSNVEAPVEVGHFDTVPWGSDRPGFGGSWSNYPFFKSGVIIVSSSEEGLFVLKRSEVDS